MTWKFPNNKSSVISSTRIERSNPVKSFSRLRLEKEYYLNTMLTGINALIERHGGNFLLEYPRLLINDGDKGEISMLYCDGLTFHNGYRPEKYSEGKMIQNELFWSHVYTKRDDWESLPVIKDLTSFFQMKTLEEVDELRKLLWPDTFAKQVG